MQIITDKRRCCGTAMCVSTAPGYFALDPKDRRVMVLQSVPAPEDLEDVQDAIEVCPTSALRLEEEARAAG